MSICITCFKSKVLPCCLSVLNVGVIGIANSPVAVYIKDITTGQIMIIPSSADGLGNVAVDVSGKSFFDNHSYELWITNAGADYGERETITIAGDEYTSVCMRFDSVTNTDGEIETFDEATIS